MPNSPASTLSATAVIYYSELPMLKELVDSFSESSDALFARTGISVSLALIDNSDNANYFAKLEQFCSLYNSHSLSLTAIKSPSNLGYGGGNNLLLNSLTSKYHLVINPDVVVQPDTLWQAVKYLDKHNDVMMLSPQVIESDGTTHHVVKTYPNCLTLLLRYLGSGSLNYRFANRLDRYQCTHLAEHADKNIELAGGCFQFMRTNIFKQLQGFDDRFFMYFEDYDLSIRIRKHGAIAYVPSVKIAHAGGDVGRKNWRHHKFFVVSALRFFTRHGWRLW